MSESWATEREQLLKRIEQLEFAIGEIHKVTEKRYLKNGFKLRCIARRCESVTSVTLSDTSKDAGK